MNTYSDTEFLTEYFQFILLRIN